MNLILDPLSTKAFPPLKNKIFPLWHYDDVTNISPLCDTYSGELINFAKPNFRLLQIGWK